MLLFLLMRSVDEAIRCHLFGIVAEHKLLPLFLAEKQRTLRSMPSDLSFKCCSSTSVSSRAVPALPNAYNPMPPLPPTRSHIKPQNRTTRSSAPPSLLPPRPTLASIRSHASLPLPPPPSSPLPPLPSYLPPRIQTGSTIHKAVYPPRSFSRPTIPLMRPTRSDPAFLCVPTPALSRQNLAVLTGRRNSMSSINSRDTTGESQIIPRLSSRRPSSLTEYSRSCTSASTVTIGTSSIGREIPDISLPEKSLVHHHGLPSRMSDTSSEGCDDLFVPSPGHDRASFDDGERSVVDSIDIFAPLPLPLPLQIRKSAIVVLPNTQHQRHQHQQQSHGQEDVGMNARLNVNERLRRYAESQSQIRRQTSRMRISTCKVGGRTCPERFRFE